MTNENISEAFLELTKNIRDNILKMIKSTHKQKPKSFFKKYFWWLGF